MKSKVKTNYIYNLIYQLFSIVTPLVTAPYISRVLGSEGVGQYSFTYSIASYFVLLGSLGFGYYAQREIAANQGDKQKQTTIFWEIIVARFISVTISIVIYVLLLILHVYEETYTILMWILLINVVSVVFDATFLFQGNEKFGIIALRNVIIKAVGIALIFIFVKAKEDVWIYAFCQCIILVFSNLSLWFGIRKMLTRIDFKSLNIQRHFLPTLRLFVPTIAISIYTMLDKTLIGTLVPGMNDAGQKFSDIENGNYEQAEKIVKLSLTMLTSLGVVMLPRNSSVVASGEKELFIKNVFGALRFTFLLGAPLCLGLAAISSNFAPWFFGSGYEKVPTLMAIFSPLILIIGISNVLGLQYLLPLKQDKRYTISIICGAFTNIILNLILIPLLWSFGACIASVAAELCVTVIMICLAKKDISFILVLKKNWKYILSASIMFGFVYVTQLFFSPSVLHTILLILEGAAIYVILIILLRDELFLSLLKKMFAIKQKKCNSQK